MLKNMEENSGRAGDEKTTTATISIPLIRQYTKNEAILLMFQNFVETFEFKGFWARLVLSVVENGITDPKNSEKITTCLKNIKQLISQTEGL